MSQYRNRPNTSESPLHVFSVSAISSKLKMLENFPAKKKKKKKKKKKGFADRPTLFFSAREPETQLFFFLALHKIMAVTKGGYA